jgi:hypothetical protein
MSGVRTFTRLVCCWRHCPARMDLDLGVHRLTTGQATACSEPGAPVCARLAGCWRRWPARDGFHQRHAPFDHQPSDSLPCVVRRADVYAVGVLLTPLANTHGLEAPASAAICSMPSPLPSFLAATAALAVDSVVHSNSCKARTARGMTHVLRLLFEGSCQSQSASPPAWCQESRQLWRHCMLLWSCTWFL